jgi:diketogulonate reductase-like aldo/keto reductase
MQIEGCGPYTVEAVKSWLKLGGRRLDAADSYDTQVQSGGSTSPGSPSITPLPHLRAPSPLPPAQMSVGRAMKESGVARKDIFLLQKIGNTNPMG